MSNIIKFKMKKLIEPSEYQECRAFWDWCCVVPGLKDLTFHIPNEGRRSKKAGSLLQRIGLRRGIPDYFIAYPRGRLCGMWIEMKRRTGGRTSPAQKEWIKKMQKQGYFAVVADGAEHAIEMVEMYLKFGERR